MINVHSDLIRKELPILGVDAFAVLMCITSHINAKRQAWPGIDRLRTMTGLSKERAYKAIQRLIETGHVERYQKNKDGVFGFVVYRVTSNYLGVYMGVNAFEMQSDETEPLSAFPEHGNPEYAKPEHGKPASISINQNGSIEQKEVLKRGKSANAPAPAEIVSRNSSETASNPLAYKTAIQIFSAEAAARGITYPAQFEEAYFLHQQAAGRYYDITPPLPGNDTHRWFSKHYAGLQAWAKRQPQFDRPGPQGAPEKPGSLSFSIKK